MNSRTSPSGGRVCSPVPSHPRPDPEPPAPRSLLSFMWRDSAGPIPQAVSPVRVLAFSGMPDPLLGTVVADRFRVDALVGEGQMARVYVAHQLSMGRKVAIKVLRREL